MLFPKLKKALSPPGFQKYFINTSWLFAEKLLRMTVGLFIGVWIARYLGPKQFGILSYAQSFVGLFAAIATLGIDGIVVRQLIKNEGKRDVLLGTAFVLKLIGAIATFGILSIAIHYTSNDNLTNILIFVIASATIFQSFNVIDSFFQSKVLSKYIVFANVITLFISTVIKVVLLLYNAPLIAFAFMVVFDNTILACGYIYVYFHNHLSIRSWQFDKILAKTLLNDSWPLILSGMVLMLQARIDQVMLKMMVGAEEVGYYSVALRLIEAFAFIPVVLKNSLSPAIINAKTLSKQLYEARLLNFYRLNFLVFLITALPIFLFAEPIVVMLFGSEYTPAGALLSLLAIRLFFTNMGVARSVYILVENLFIYSLIAMTFGTATNIILNYILIPNYHGVGAIISTIISFFVTVFFVDAFYSKTNENFNRMVQGIVTFYKIRR